MQKVNQRMTSKQYDTLEDMVSDFVLIFDNACKYNEPDSLIYKDALTLQRVCLEKKQELCADDDANEVPDVRALVHEMMTNLYIAMYNHTVSVVTGGGTSEIINYKHFRIHIHFRIYVLKPVCRPPVV